jgi:hypothetical protein
VVIAGLFACGFALSATGAPAASSAASFTYCAPQQADVLEPKVLNDLKTVIDVCDQKRITAVDVVEVSSRTPIEMGDYYNSECVSHHCGDCSPDQRHERSCLSYERCAWRLTGVVCPLNDVSRRLAASD